MGAALCSCGGRGEEPGARGLAGYASAGGGLSLQALGLERHVHARNGKAVPLAVAAKYSGLAPAPGHALRLARATPELHSRGETYALSDECECAADELQRRAPAPVTAQAIADAFRAKLHEPPLSPRSKFHLLITKIGGAMDASDSEGAREDEEEDEEDEEDAATRTCEEEEDEEEETPEGGRRRRRKARRPRRKGPADALAGLSSLSAAAAAEEEEDASLTEEDWKARADPLVTIIVPPGPCGLVLQVGADAQGRTPPIVDGFVRTYDGLKGTIENSGLVAKGSVLCAINDIDVTRMPLKEVIRTLNLSSHLERQFAFRGGAAGRARAL